MGRLMFYKATYHRTEGKRVLEILCKDKDYPSGKDWDIQAIFEVKMFGRLKLLSCNRFECIFEMEELAKYYILGCIHLL